MTIWFDMDGTIANLYGVDNWLSKLRASDPSPYAEAAVMMNMSQLARALNMAQAAGYQLGVISWLSKSGSAEYGELVEQAKLKWLKNHLKSVKWDSIHIVVYGIPKQTFMQSDKDILFDDEERNRDSWTGNAYEPQSIMEVLKKLIANT